jgi:imidazolonepropionase-like amidohydrolase
MTRSTLIAGAMLAATVAAPAAIAGSFLIRNATVHTMTAAGTQDGADILITDGKVTAVGHALKAPADAQVIDAAGRIVTPGLFGGMSHLGLDEIGLEPTQQDYELRLGAMRPEFDVMPAFNPDATSVGVNRVGGVTFAVVAPTPADSQGTIIAGQGSVVTLDGSVLPASRALFVDVGADVAALSGGSRAAQFMLLRQAFTEARTPNLVLNNDQRLLTPLGRQALLEFISGAAPFVINVDRAADIRQVLAFAAREKLKIAISGGAEAWRVAPELAAAKVPVILDPLVDLPANFDDVGATLENAARLDKAGVRVAFSFGDPESHNVRKLRQAAGIAVAHGLPWQAGLAAITRVPAEIFGVAGRVGSIETGRLANLVVWSGDPLEVTSVAEQVFIEGKLQPQTSRQTELRDRYLERLRRNAAR